MTALCHSDAGIRRARERSARRVAVALFASVLFAGCGGEEPSRDAQLRHHVAVLASEAFEGRATGRAGERLAARYLVDAFRAAGLEPLDERGFLHGFDFGSGVRLGTGNTLRGPGDPFVLGEAWQPLGFSETGDFGPYAVVFGGYGFAAPETPGVAAVDSYGAVDVSGVWLLVLRDWPEGASDVQRQHWGRYAGLRYKAILARERGAAGLLVVQRGAGESPGGLIPLRFDGTAGSAGIPVLSLSEAAADRLLADTGHALASLRERLDAGEALGAFAVPEVELAASVRLDFERSDGVNVIGRLGVGDPNAPAVVIGAHYDHLGRAAARGSLARGEERTGIHYGADDNASGVAAMVEIAAALRARVDDGDLEPRRDAIFAAWSGEELGLLGSHAFARDTVTDAGAAADPDAPGSADAAEAVDPHAASPADPHAQPERFPLREHVAANLNLDMVGRLRETLLLQGGESSSRWESLVAEATERVEIPVELQQESLLPTDASTFATRGVPVLSAFTGAHAEYHTPRDTPDTLDYVGLDAVTRLLTEVAALLLEDPEAPDYRAPRRDRGPGGAHPRRAVRLRAYLGTVPDYATDALGMPIATVVDGGPAQRAGLRGGDVVVELAGKAVRNVYDYTFAIEAMRPGEPVEMVVSRDGRRVALEITPEARQ